MSHSMYTIYVVLFSGNVMSSPELVFEGVTFVLSFLVIQFLGKRKKILVAKLNGMLKS